MRSILTLNGVKKIIEDIWISNNDNFEIVNPSGKIETHTFVDYLNVKFYVYKKEAKYSGSYAIIKSNGEDVHMHSSVDFFTKNITIKFQISEDKVNQLELYANKLRKNYIGIAQNYIINGDSTRVFLDFGYLKYDKPPHTSQIGVSIECSLDLVLVCTTNTSVNNKVWMLDGKIIPYITETISLSKTGLLNDVPGAKATQNLPTSQSRVFNFMLPYITENDVCRTLQIDILESNLLKTYELSYYDGVDYTELNPYKTNVTLFTTNRSSSQLQSVATFEITFYETDSGISVTMYDIVLIDNKFGDPGSNNIRWFANQQEQITWYNNRITISDLAYSRIISPNISTLQTSTQIYFAKKLNGENANIGKVLSKNYAIIRETENGNIKYYYYRAYPTAGSENQILVNLFLDTVQTYYFDPNVKISQCIINKAHLNRWVNNGDGTVTFDSRPNNSLLFKRENYQDLSPRLVERTELYFRVDDRTRQIAGQTRMSQFDEFLRDVVDYWVYIFLPQIRSSTNNNYTEMLIRGIPLGISCIPVPVYKQGETRRIRLTAGQLRELGLPETLEIIRNQLLTTEWSLNNIIQNFSSVIATAITIKASVMNPFMYLNYVMGNANDVFAFGDIDYYFSGLIPGDLVLPFQSSGIGVNPVFGHRSGLMLERNVPTGQSSTLVRGIPYIMNSNTANYPTEFHNIYNITFQILDVVNNPNIVHNPKLYGMDYRQLILESMDGQKFEYDIQKLGHARARFLYTEAITPDVTRGYLRAEITQDSVYAKDTENNLTGLVYSIDNSMIYSASQWDIFMANNKNFFAQAQMQKDYATRTTGISSGIGMLGSAAGLAGSIKMGMPLGIIASGIGITNTASGALTGIERAGLNFRKKMMSAENMQAAPNNVKNSSGNHYFISFINGQKLYVSSYEALNEEIVEANDDMLKNGYTYGQIDDIKNVDNIRAHYNYVEAEVTTIDGELSNEARQDIRDRFSNGVRFWKVDDVDYKLSNHEISLEKK